MDDDSRSFNLALRRCAFVIFLPISIYLIELSADLDFYWMGVYPRTIKGIPGIIASPLKHGDTAHLFGNLILMIPLLLGFFLNFGSKSFKTLALITLITNVWLWLGGRSSWHYGASGIVYGMFFYLFILAIKYRQKELFLFPLIVLFLSAGFWVGLLPVQFGVSFESHILGSLAGTMIALFQKKPKKNTFIDTDPQNSTINVKYNYIYKENSEKS